MADIDVVKKSSNAWIWVIAAIAIVVVLFLLFGRGGGSTSSPTGSLRPAPQGVEQGVAAWTPAPTTFAHV
jgi:hypothetical protein